MHTWVFQGSEQQVGSVLADMALNFGDKDLGLTPEDSRLLVDKFGIESFMEFLLYCNKKYAMMHGYYPPEPVGPFFGLGVTHDYVPPEYQIPDPEPPTSVWRMLEYGALFGLAIVGTVTALNHFDRK